MNLKFTFYDKVYLIVGIFLIAELLLLKQTRFTETCIWLYLIFFTSRPVAKLILRLYFRIRGGHKNGR